MYVWLLFIFSGYVGYLYGVCVGIRILEFSYCEEFWVIKRLV